MAGKIALAVVISIVGLAIIVGYCYIGWRGLKASAVNRDNAPFTRHQWHMVLGLVGTVALCVGLGEVIALVAHFSKDPVTSMAAGSGMGAGLGVLVGLLFFAYEATRARHTEGSADSGSPSDRRPYPHR